MPLTWGDFGFGLGSKAFDFGLSQLDRASQYGYYKKSSRFAGRLADQRWKDRIGYMQESLGLTPNEIVGSPAMSAGGAGGGSFGNAAQIGESLERRMAERADYRRLRSEEKKVAAELQTRKDIAQIGAQATVDAAGISAAPGHARVSVEQARNEWQQTHDQERVAILKRQADREADKYNIQRETFEPAFVLYKTAMGMSAANMRATAIYAWLRDQGLDILKRDGKPIDPIKMAEIIERMGSEDSTFLRELRGLLFGAEVVEGRAQGAVGKAAQAGSKARQWYDRQWRSLTSPKPAYKAPLPKE